MKLIILSILFIIILSGCTLNEIIEEESQELEIVDEVIEEPLEEIDTSQWESVSTEISNNENTPAEKRYAEGDSSDK
jgi:hypothetical protein